MVDYTSKMTYKIEYDKRSKRVTKYYHNQRPLKTKYKKEVSNNPIMYFYQEGSWIGLDTK